MGRRRAFFVVVAACALGFGAGAAGLAAGAGEPEGGGDGACAKASGGPVSGAGVILTQRIGGKAVLSLGRSTAATRFHEVEGLGGGCEGEGELACAAREAHEETAGLVSMRRRQLRDASRVRIQALEPGASYVTFFARPPTPATSRDFRSHLAQHADPSGAHDSPWTESDALVHLPVAEVLRAHRASEGRGLDSRSDLHDVRGRRVRPSARLLAVLNAAACRGLLAKLA